MAVLKFSDGAGNFRLRVVISFLCRRTVVMTNIRPYHSNPGLRDCEVSFLRLVESMTNGTFVEINETGTQVRIKPGFVVNGDVEHECCLTRSIGWYLEGILPLACFGKADLRLDVTGVTDGFENSEASVDYVKNSMLPLLKRFGVGADEDEVSVSFCLPSFRPFFHPPSFLSPSSLLSLLLPQLAFTLIHSFSHSLTHHSHFAFRISHFAFRQSHPRRLLASTGGARPRWGKDPCLSFVQLPSPSAPWTSPTRGR